MQSICVGVCGGHVRNTEALSMFRAAQKTGIKLETTPQHILLGYPDTENNAIWFLLHYSYSGKRVVGNGEGNIRRV